MPACLYTFDSWKLNCVKIPFGWVRLCGFLLLAHGHISQLGSILKSLSLEIILLLFGKMEVGLFSSLCARIKQRQGETNWAIAIVWLWNIEVSRKILRIRWDEMCNTDGALIGDVHCNIFVLLSKWELFRTLCIIFQPFYWKQWKMIYCIMFFILTRVHTVLKKIFTRHCDSLRE